MAKNLIDGESFEFIEGTEKSDYIALEGRVSTAEGNISGHEVRLANAETSISNLNGNVTQAITILPFAFGDTPHEITTSTQIADVALPIPLTVSDYSHLMFEWYIITLQPNGTVTENNIALETKYVGQDDTTASSSINFYFTDNYDAEGINYRINTITQIVKISDGSNIRFGKSYLLGTAQDERRTQDNISATFPDKIAKIRVRFPYANTSNNKKEYTRGILLRITGIK